MTGWFFECHKNAVQKFFREKRSRNMKPHHHQYPFKWEALGLEIILRVQNACIEDPAMKYLT